eukprot:m.138009 g.138009  ORF g.138009 m.138009 type:complete len:63 (+) comp17593_c0_seq2:137-325(+)
MSPMHACLLHAMRMGIFLRFERGSQIALVVGILAALVHDVVVRGLGFFSNCVLVAGYTVEIN